MFMFVYVVDMRLTSSVRNLPHIFAVLKRLVIFCSIYYRDTIVATDKWLLQTSLSYTMRLAAVGGLLFYIDEHLIH